MTGQAFTSRRIARLAEKALTGRLGPRGQTRLAARLDQSPEDQHAYARLALAFRALEGFPPLAQAQVQRVQGQVLAALGQARPEPPTALRYFQRFALPLGVLALVAALPLLGPGLFPAEEPFAARGATRVDLRSAMDLPLADLTPFCIRDGVVVKTPPRLTPGSPDALCELRDELQLMLTHKAGFRYLLVVGQALPPARSESLLWYFPVPPTGRSGLAPRDIGYAPLGQAIRLRINHAPSEVRLVALFSNHPVQAETLHGWLRTLESRQSAPPLVAGLLRGEPHVVVERRVLIRKGTVP